MVDSIARVCRLSLKLDLADQVTLIGIKIDLQSSEVWSGALPELVHSGRMIHSVSLMMMRLRWKDRALFEYIYAFRIACALVNASYSCLKCASYVTLDLHSLRSPSMSLFVFVPASDYSLRVRLVTLQRRQTRAKYDTDRDRRERSRLMSSLTSMR